MVTTEEVKESRYGRYCMIALAAWFFFFFFFEGRYHYPVSWLFLSLIIKIAPCLSNFSSTATKAVRDPIELQFRTKSLALSL